MAFNLLDKVHACHFNYTLSNFLTKCSYLIRTTNLKLNMTCLITNQTGSYARESYQTVAKKCAQGRREIRWRCTMHTTVRNASSDLIVCKRSVRGCFRASRLRPASSAQLQSAVSSRDPATPQHGGARPPGPGRHRTRSRPDGSRDGKRCWRCTAVPTLHPTDVRSLE